MLSLNIFLRIGEVVQNPRIQNKNFHEILENPFPIASWGALTCIVAHHLITHIKPSHVLIIVQYHVRLGHIFVSLSNYFWGGIVASAQQQNWFGLRLLFSKWRKDKLTFPRLDACCPTASLTLQPSGIPLELALTVPVRIVFCCSRVSASAGLV